MGKAELMAPAGSFAAITAAINAGCDSVFFGVQQLNMRSRSSANFSLEDMKAIAQQCQEAKVKSYITLNTLLYQHDLTLMRLILDTAKESGIDAVIVQDVAAMQHGQSIGLSLHASTQLSISNIESVRFYAQFCDTIVLARELDLNMVKDICDKVKEEKITGPNGEIVRIEVFVHGALCIAQSGRCQMSLLSNNTSAQRGACLQECRKKYKIIDEDSGVEMVVDNQYIMSPKDLCCIPFLDRLIEAGISVLKIEGRGRSPQYVDTVIRTYREAIDSVAAGSFNQEKVEKWMKELATVYNRGFCDGYYLGKPLPEWSSPAGNKSTEERVFLGLINHHYPKAQIAEINLQAYDLKKDDRLVIMGNNTGVVYADAKEIMLDEKLIQEAKRGSLVTIPIKEKVRKNDKVYLLKTRI